MAIDLLIEAKGQAESLSDAMSEFSGAAQAALSIIAVASNTPIEQPPLVELAYDVDPEIHEHEFFQRYLPDPPMQFLQGRRVKPEHLAEFFEILGKHPELDRLMRAITQYNIALTLWHPGSELLAMNYLWIGMEALTPVALRRALEAENADEEKLYAKWNLNCRENRRSSRVNKLNAELKKRVLFQGDGECYRMTREASDGFEHGFMSFPEMHSRAHRVRNKTSRYLRQAIFDLVGVSDELREGLLSSPFDRPLERWKLDFQIFAKLTGSADNLAAEGKEHPYMEWSEPNILAAPVSDRGFKFTFKDQNLTARIGKEALFSNIRFEVWAPSLDPLQSD